MTYLSPHFTLEEFTRSDIAKAEGIDNSLPPELWGNAVETAEMLERVRDFLGAIKSGEIPITLSSGYRCEALNAALGSKPTSDHPRAKAADWIAPKFGSPYDICKALAPRIDDVGIGQLIYECPSPGRVWVHTSTRKPDRVANRVITISVAGTLLGIQKV